MEQGDSCRRACVILIAFLAVVCLIPTTPGYSQSTYRVKIIPEISVKQVYDDNIFLSKEDKKADYITSLMPGILIDINSGKNGLIFHYTFGGVIYHNLSENNFARHDVEFNSWQQITRRLKVIVEDEYLKSDDIFDKEIDQHLKSQGTKNSTASFYRNDVGISFDYQLGPEDHIIVGYNHGFLKNDDHSLGSAVEHGPFGTLSYWFDKKNGIELGYQFKRYDFSGGGDSAESRQDIDSHDTYAKLTKRFDRQTTAHLYYGLVFRNFTNISKSYYVHDAELGVQSDLFHDISLSLNIGISKPTGDISKGKSFIIDAGLSKIFKRGKITLRAERGWDEGYMELQPRGFTRYWISETELEYNPLEKLDIYAAISYRKNDYASMALEKDKTYTGRCGLSVKFFRWFSGELEYVHQTRISDDLNNEYLDNRVTLTISASRPHLHKWKF